MHQGLGVPQEKLWVSKLGYTEDEAAEFQRLKQAEERRKVADTAAALREGRMTEGDDMAAVVESYQRAAGALGRLA